MLAAKRMTIIPMSFVLIALVGAAPAHRDIVAGDRDLVGKDPHLVAGDRDLVSKDPHLLANETWDIAADRDYRAAAYRNA
jgi:hypothetical protein